jgi:uncharacterized protein (TIGR02996 family)
LTTEDDFQRALDKRPGDWQTRLVFADWLQERGDPRAEGYRALGLLRLVPHRVKYRNAPWRDQMVWVLGNDNNADTNRQVGAMLPTDWFTRVRQGPGSDSWWVRNPKRSELEDAVAAAFSQLPAERRAELLTEPTDTAPKKAKQSAPVKKPKKPKT